MSLELWLGAFVALFVLIYLLAVLARPEMLQALRPSSTPLHIDDGGTHEVALTAVPRPRP